VRGATSASERFGNRFISHPASRERNLRDRHIYGNHSGLSVSDRSSCIKQPIEVRLAPADICGLPVYGSAIRRFDEGVVAWCNAKTTPTIGPTDNESDPARFCWRPCCVNSQHYVLHLAVCDHEHPFAGLTKKISRSEAIGWIDLVRNEFLFVY
jgi:hypothetical protein